MQKVILNIIGLLILSGIVVGCMQETAPLPDPVADAKQTDGGGKGGGAGAALAKE